MANKEHWTEDQLFYLLDNLEKLTLKDIADNLGKSELAVQLYILRKRIPYGTKVGRNLVLEILRIKFVNPSYFHPNKDFYHAVQLNQKRWWNLYFGREKITEGEYVRLIEHFQVSLKDAFDARQLNLFDQ